MLQFLKKLLPFHRDERGLTIVEYAIAGGLIAIGVVVAFITLGGNVNQRITELGEAVMGNGPAAE